MRSLELNLVGELGGGGGGVWNGMLWVGVEGGETFPSRARIFKLLRSPRIDFKEPIAPGCVAWQAGTITLFLLGSWPP